MEALKTLPIVNHARKKSQGREKRFSSREVHSGWQRHGQSRSKCHGQSHDNFQLADLT